MASAIVKRRDLEKYRNLIDAERFIARVFAQIEKNDKEERTPYRLSKGYYKYFNEEYIPIFKYLKHVYGLSNSIMFKHVGIDNQPYDGVVKIGDLYHRIEIAYLYLGKYAKDQQKSIIEKHGAYSIYDADELYLQIKKLILDTAKKKAKKPYGDTLLVLYYASGEDLYPGDVGLSEERFSQVIDELKEISYHAKKVNFFLPSFEYTNSEGAQFKPARIFIIK